MCEKYLFKYVSDVMVVKVFFFNSVNFKIINLSLYIKYKLLINFVHILVN